MKNRIIFVLLILCVFTVAFTNAANNTTPPIKTSTPTTINKTIPIVNSTVISNSTTSNAAAQTTATSNVTVQSTPNITNTNISNIITIINANASNNTNNTGLNNTNIFNNTGLINTTNVSNNTLNASGLNITNASNNTGLNNTINASNNTATNLSNNTKPTISNIKVVDISNSTVDIKFSVDQDASTIINYGTTPLLGTLSAWDNGTSSNRDIKLSGLLNETEYSFNIRAYNGINISLFTDSGTESFKTSNNSFSISNNTNISKISDNIPNISNTDPEQSIKTIEKNRVNFTISFDRVVNVIWLLNNTIVKQDNGVTSSSYDNSTSSIGTYNVTAVGTNNNGTVPFSWNWVVEPQTFETGNRVWDGSKGMSTTYMWNSFSFAGFFYDIDTNLSTEELVMKDIKRTIDVGDITYTASPQQVKFAYQNFGSYQVVGFMANKYFAGYSGQTIPNPTNGFEDISTISQGQLHKVLIDDESQHTISLGGTLALQDGYILKAVDIDLNARTMLVSLLKDGVEVDTTPLSKDQTYVYKKTVGNVQDLPIIMVRFDNVFSGTETQAAFLKGVFQISENVTSVKAGDTYGRMEVSGVSGNITMENGDTVDLSPGDTIDLMGDLKIIVADDNNDLRFALSVVRNEPYDVRGTIYPITSKWDPMNFGLNVGNTNIGFYYNLDDDVGTESLNINTISGDTIPSDGLIYSTTAQEVSYKYSNFGKYQVVGFMADKYFAGYSGQTIPNPTNSFEDISTISQGQLHQVLIDDDIQRTISLGGTLTLQDGYVLRANDIDLNARTMLISLLKDGVEVDSTPLSKDQTYVYRKTVGNVQDLPIIMVRFDNVFSGTETQAAFLKGLFQISENVTSVKSGDSYGNMKVATVSGDSITLTNDGSIGLSRGDIVNVMGNIKFRVADSSDLRFYPFVSATPGMIGGSAAQLVLNLPNRATGGDAVNISITAGNVPIEGASIRIDPGIGLINQTTDINGNVNFTFPLTAKGRYNVSVTKVGYESANTAIDIQQYIVGILNIDISSTNDTIDQYTTIQIQTSFNDTGVGNVTLAYDNITIGSTDSKGNLSYTFNDSGLHTLTASKFGYVSVSRDLNIIGPYAEFKAQDINVTPNNIISGDNVIVRSNITNIGTKGDTKSIDLIINGTVVNNMSLYLSSKQTKEINFTQGISLPQGNYTIEILGQKELVEVQKKSLNISLIAIVATIIGILAIYMVTKKKK